MFRLYIDYELMNNYIVNSTFIVGESEFFELSVGSTLVLSINKVYESRSYDEICKGKIISPICYMRIASLYIGYKSGYVKVGISRDPFRRVLQKGFDEAIILFEEYPPIEALVLEDRLTELLSSKLDIWISKRFTIRDFVMALKRPQNQINIVEKITKLLYNFAHSKFRIFYTSAGRIFPRILRAIKILSINDLIGRKIKGKIRNVWGSYVILRYSGEYILIEIPYQFEGEVNVK